MVTFSRAVQGQRNALHALPPPPCYVSPHPAMGSAYPALRSCMLFLCRRADKNCSTLAPLPLPACPTLLLPGACDPLPPLYKDLPTPTPRQGLVEAAPRANAGPDVQPLQDLKANILASNNTFVSSTNTVSP